MSETKNYEQKASDKVKKIVAAIKEKTAVDAYKINIIKDSTPDIFDSKFGGVPYWDMSREYPSDDAGKKMMLLAQINFTKAALKDERLPKQGMLQFFIASEDDVFGMDWDDPDSQKNFRVVFHEHIDETITEEQVRSLHIPIATEGDDIYSPVFKEAKIEICSAKSYMGPSVFGFVKVFRQIVKEQTGEDISGMNVYQYLSSNDYRYLYDELCNARHWMLGYPFFTQDDPREGMDQKNADYYDTVLFQMDSDGDYVLWGDCGVANFFINKEALKKRDFRKVLYNWDCC